MTNFVNLHKKSFFNWSRTCRCNPSHFASPKSIEEIRQILAFCRENGLKLKPGGSLMSPGNIAMTSEFLMDMSNFNKLIDIDSKKMVVCVQSGMKLKTLINLLKNRGFAFSALGSVTGQTIGGLISTAVHGTGLQHGSFSSIIAGLKILDSEGNFHFFENDFKNGKSAIFKAASVGLGCFGIIIEIKLKFEKLYYLKSVQTPILTTDLFTQILKLSKKYEYFRAWIFPYTNYSVSWYAERLGDNFIYDDFGIKNNALKTNKTKIKFLSPIKAYIKALNSFKNELSQKIIRYFFEFSLLISKAFPAILPLINKIYFKLNFTENPKTAIGCYDEIFTFDCLFSQHVNEWAIPAENAAKALTELMAKIYENGHKAHLPIEVRFSKSEEAYLSPAFGMACCYVGVISYRPFGVEIPHDDFFADFEAIMRRFNGRPHWAKICCCEKCLKRSGLGKDYFAKVYPKWNEWVNFRNKIDKFGIFVTNWAKNVLFL